MNIDLFLDLNLHCVITNSNGERKVQITETKLYVSVVTISTQDNAKLLQ